MMNTRQRTLAAPAQLTGVGLHSNKPVTVNVLPAKPNTGIVFHRTDSEYASLVEAHVFNVGATELSTSIGTGASSVSTIEHLMAAFAGLGIDNALVRLDGPEVPIMDGSSSPFVEAFLAAGVIVQRAKRRYYEVIKTFEFVRGDKTIRIEPSRKTRFKCSIDFPVAVIGKQSSEIELTAEGFLELAFARTFCHVKEVTAMRNAGFALGGSLQNAIVVDDAGVLNKEGLRARDEFARHKLLDAIGDFMLLGAPLLGKVTLYKTGHSMHAQCLEELLKNKSKYLREFYGETSSPSSYYETSDDTIPLVAAAVTVG